MANQMLYKTEEEINLALRAIVAAGVSENSLVELLRNRHSSRRNQYFHICDCLGRDLFHAALEGRILRRQFDLCGRVDNLTDLFQPIEPAAWQPPPKWSFENKCFILHGIVGNYRHICEDNVNSAVNGFEGARTLAEIRLIKFQLLQTGMLIERRGVLYYNHEVAFSGRVRWAYHQARERVLKHINAERARSHQRQSSYSRSL